MKKVIFAILIILAMVLTGCAPTHISNEPKKESTFIVVEKNDIFKVVYDKETKVMHSVSYYSHGAGQLTLLVNADGTPKLWKGDQQ